MPRPRNQFVERAVFDLDELLGQSHTVPIRWQGREYALKNAYDLSSLDTVRIDRLLKTIATEGDSLEATAKNQDDGMIEALSILCPDLPAAEVPFVLRMKIIDHWRTVMTDEKKAQTENQIGKKSIPN
jgi:hypothetical protein